MNEISFTFSKILLKLSDPQDWPFATSITGKVVDVAPGVFEMTLSHQNLKRIGNIFVGAKKPVVVGGQRILDGLKSRFSFYKLCREGVQNVLSKTQYPVEPNGKFIPYSHQTLIIGTVLSNPYSPIFADCGLGKTGALGRAVELLINSGAITRGKVLVSAPLSILHTSWADDTLKFTSLKIALLWTPTQNKSLLGEERVLIADLGPKPQGVVTTKTKTGLRYRHQETNEAREKITALDGQGWVKYRASWKVGIDINGVEYPYGEVTGRTLNTERTRENYIREQISRTDVDLYICNHDSVRLYQEILKEHEFQWVIVDESTKIKSPVSKVFRAHVNISWKCRRRNILTGTPNPNGYEDLWGQYYFLDRGMTLEPSKKDFLNEFFKPITVGFVNTPGGRKEAIRYEIKGDREKEALISRVRSVGIFLEQRDCINLPERTDTSRLAYMTPTQEAAYDRMSRDLVAELTNTRTGKQVGAEAVNVLAKVMKLRQITSGFLIGKGGEIAHLETNPKWTVLDEYLEELCGKKLVIACQFREEIECLVQRYRSRGCRAIYGGVAVEERARTIRDFQETNSCEVLVIQPQAAAHGITLTAASHLAYLSLDYNFEYYYQVAKRVERLGQVHPIFVTHIIARYQDGDETIDEDLMGVLASKKGDRNALFQSSDSEEIANRLTQRLIQQVEKRHGRN